MTRTLVEPAAISRLRDEYSNTGIAHLPGFFNPGVVALLSRQLAKVEFFIRNEVAKTSGAIFGTTQLVEGDDRAVVMLHFLLNRPELFEMARQVSGIPKPGNFICRVHRTAPSSQQHIDWHGDAIETRMLGLNINLSPEEFGGGLFQLRDAAARIMAEVRHTRPGDAFLFRIDGGWEHRLTEVTSGTRTVAVGWFRRLPEWRPWRLTPHADLSTPDRQVL